MTELHNSFTQDLVQVVYFISALLFIFGLKKMSSASSARTGLILAAIAMIIAVLITLFHHEVQSNYLWMTLAIFIGGSLAFLLSKRAEITQMPKMIALYSGLGAGAVASISAVELIKLEAMPNTVKYFAVAAALIGSIGFSGCLVAFVKLQGILKGPILFPMQQWLNALLIVVAITFGIALVLNGNQYEATSLMLLFIFALLFGALMTIAMNNSDMPALISLLTALIGVAIGFAGYVLLNPAMMIAGSLVAATAMKLTLSMTKSMNRPMSHILFGSAEADDSFDSSFSSSKKSRELQSNDAAMMMAFAKNIIIVPGYGMAAAQAQHKTWEMSQLLKDNGVNVKFAIHPSAGRMPGHMNVLLAEAGIPYESIYDIDEINGEFNSADVVLLIGANDTTNTSARSEQSSPIFGMPILNADRAKNIIVIKRGEGTGFSNIDNPLLYQENTGLLYGDAQSVLSQIVSDLKKI